MQKFVVNGQSYESLEAMPPDVQAAYQQSFAAANPHGTPDDLFGSSEFDHSPPPNESWFASDQQVPQVPQWNRPPPTRSAGIKKWMLLMILLDMLIFGGFMVWYFLLS